MHVAAKHKEIYDRVWRMAGSFADAINMRNGWASDHPLPRHIIDAAKEAAERSSGYSMFGISELKAAIAAKLQRENGLDVDPEKEILVTNGGSEAMHLAVWALIDPGDEVIMANPGYIAGYVPNILMAGGKMVFARAREERRFKLDPEDVETLVTGKTKMIIVVSPEHPTGAIFDKVDLEGIAEIADRHDSVVLSDEIFEKLVYDGKKNFSIGAIGNMEDRTITINGFAKGYNMPGYRVGYVAGPEAIVQRMANVQLHTTVSVNEIGQRAALAALQGPQDWIERAVRAYEVRRNLLVKGLNKIGMRCLIPEGGFSAFPSIKEFGMSSDDFSDYLLREAHILTQSGQSYYGSWSEGYIKISFTRPINVLEEALKRILLARQKLCRA
jgi:aminotransferase